jgi:hypothetical protein
MDNFEQQLKDSLTANVEIPQSVVNKVQNAFEEIRKSDVRPARRNLHFGGKQLAATAIAVILLATVFNQPLIAFVKATLWGNHAGLEKAVENGYQQELQNDFTYSKDVGMKITNVVVDPARLALSIDVKLDDAAVVKTAKEISLDMIVRDSNGNVIHGDGYPNQIIGGYEENTDMAGKENGELKYNVLFHSTSAGIPSLKELNVEVNRVILHGENVVQPIKIIEGSWDFHITLDGQFAEGKKVAYNPENDSKDVKVISAEMLPTGFVIKFIVNEPLDENIWQKVELTDMNGNIFKNSGSFSMNPSAENKKLDVISMTFEVSEFDKTEAFNFTVKDINGKNSTVKLTKSQK